MKVFNYAFNTWLFAQFLHPLIFFAWFSFVLNDPMQPAALVSLLVGAFIVSAPSLFISFLLLRYITSKKITTSLSFVLWIFIAAGSIVVNIILFVFLFISTVSDIPFDFIIPSFIAAFLSILIRMPLFFDLITSIKKDKSYEGSLHYEN